MDKWEFLILRAQLAGIKTEDTGTHVIFRTNYGDSLRVLKEMESGEQDAATWLLARGVNLPGWDTWPDDDCTDEGGHDWELMEDGALRCTYCGVYERGGSMDRLMTWPDEQAEMRADIAAEKAAYDYEVGR